MAGASHICWTLLQESPRRGWGRAPSGTERPRVSSYQTLVSSCQQLASNTGVDGTGVRSGACRGLTHESRCRDSFRSGRPFGASDATARA